MATYLLERNKKLYYRRRIPTQLTKHFSNMSEIRLQVSQKSYFQAIMYIDVLNSIFEEKINMVYLSRENAKLDNQLLDKVKDFADTSPTLSKETGITFKNLYDMFMERLSISLLLIKMKPRKHIQMVIGQNSCMKG